MSVKDYLANSILQRVDPADWILENPWLKERFAVALSLSKRAVNAKRTELGLVRQTEWNDEPAESPVAPGRKEE